MLETGPQAIQILAAFAEKDHFLQNYMYHVPSGGIFVDFSTKTSDESLHQDRSELIGKIAEVRITIARPKIDMVYRGAITFASPVRNGFSHRRIGIEFFRYETDQKNFLIDLLNDPQNAPELAEIARRQQRRYPAKFRIQFRCKTDTAQNQNRVASQVSITGRTENLSLNGCSFTSVRFFQPGTPLTVRLQISKEDALQPAFSPKTEELHLKSIVRWNDEKNFSSRRMGIEFDFNDPETQKAKPYIEEIVHSLQHTFETELIKRRYIRPTLQI